MPKVVAPIKYLDTCVIVRRSPGVVGNVDHSHDGDVVHYTESRMITSLIYYF